MGSASRDANAFDCCQLAAAQDGSSDGRRALPIAREPGVWPDARHALGVGEEQVRSLGVLLLDGCESGAGADRPQADASPSSSPVVCVVAIRSLAFVDKKHCRPALLL